MFAFGKAPRPYLVPKHAVRGGAYDFLFRKKTRPPVFRENRARHDRRGHAGACPLHEIVDVFVRRAQHTNSRREHINAPASHAVRPGSVVLVGRADVGGAHELHVWARDTGTVIRVAVGAEASKVGISQSPRSAYAIARTRLTLSFSTTRACAKSRRTHTSACSSSWVPTG